MLVTHGAIELVSQLVTYPGIRHSGRLAIRVSLATYHV